uniref:Odorant-binding protein 20 n=1 Tax=Pyrrhalta maculicollis TaxID=226885 RepID=A0A1J0KKG3_9CUCU|nr:odorant-binding protein 20 [Pyrrhalta maculicollis]
MMVKSLNFCYVGLLWFINSVTGLSEEMQELANMLHTTCVEETGAIEDDILNARKGIFADKEEFKCYIKCLMAQMACIDDDGIIDVEATIAVLPEEYRDKAAPIVKKCGTKSGKTPCENAWLTHQCYYKEAPDDYFLI